MALGRIKQKDWYQVLGASPSDSPAELKRKYQKLALLYHPDKQEADVPAGEVEERVQRFIEIDQAWKILRNEETKKEYDLQQREDNLTKDWPLHAQIYLEDMSWNEDEQLYTLSCRCGGNYSVCKSETKDPCSEQSPKTFPQIQALTVARRRKQSKRHIIFAGDTSVSFPL